MVNGISPECNYALGTGPVTLNSGATLQFERANPTNALTLNGGTFYSQNGWGVTWQGPVTVNSNTTLRASYSLKITGTISGTGGFTKTGSDTVTLSGVNTYTGANVVQAGTLSCSQAASLGHGALSISNSAVVNLNGGTNAAVWTNSAYVGSWTNVVSTNISYTATSLTPNTTYYFTFRGTNAGGSVWATNVLSLTTLRPPPPPVLLGSAIAFSNGVPNFTFATTAGYKYRLVYKNTFMDISWLPVLAPPDFLLPAGWSADSTGAPMSLSDTNTVGQPQRFYRLEAATP